MGVAVTCTWREMTFTVDENGWNGPDSWERRTLRRLFPREAFKSPNYARDPAIEAAEAAAEMFAIVIESVEGEDEVAAFGPWPTDGGIVY